VEAIRLTENVVRWVGRLSRGQNDSFFFRSNDDGISETDQLAKLAPMASSALEPLKSPRSPPLEVVVTRELGSSSLKPTARAVKTNSVPTSSTLGDALSVAGTPQRSRSGLLEATLPFRPETRSTGPDLEQARHPCRSQSSQSVVPLNMFDRSFFPAGDGAYHSLGSIHTRTSGTLSMAGVSKHAGHIFFGSSGSIDRLYSFQTQQLKVGTFDLEHQSDSESRGRTGSGRSLTTHVSSHHTLGGRHRGPPKGSESSFSSNGSLSGLLGSGSLSGLLGSGSLSGLLGSGGMSLLASGSSDTPSASHFLHLSQFEPGGTIAEERPPRPLHTRTEKISAVTDQIGEAPPNDSKAAHARSGDSSSLHSLASRMSSLDMNA
jgi:hypothetical protein